MRHMLTKFTTEFKKGSSTYDQSSILSSCSRFQNTASLRCSPESRRTCFSCRLGDVGILQHVILRRGGCGTMVPWYHTQRQQQQQLFDSFGPSKHRDSTPIKCLMALENDFMVFLTSFGWPPKKWDSMLSSGTHLPTLRKIHRNFRPGIVVAGDATILVDGTRSRDGFPHLETLHLGGQGDSPGAFRHPAWHQRVNLRCPNGMLDSMDIPLGMVLRCWRLFSDMHPMYRYKKHPFQAVNLLEIFILT